MTRLSILARPRRASRLLRRGFTLVEMMIVVCIIAIFAAIAAPSVIHLVRDQRTVKQATQIMSLYREARARSIGRGAAVMINFDAAGDTTAPAGPLFQIREAIDASGLPNPRCTSPAWTTLYSLGTPRDRSTLQLSNDTKFYPNSSLYDPNSPPPTVGINQTCFTPSGRIFTRNALAAPWSPLQGRTVIAVRRKEPGVALPIGLIRSVQVNVDGTTRFIQQ